MSNDVAATLARAMSTDALTAWVICGARAAQAPIDKLSGLEDMRQMIDTRLAIDKRLTADSRTKERLRRALLASLRA